MAGEVIEIQGGLARLFRVDGEGRRVLDRQVSLRSLADALAARGPRPGVLPPGTRLVLTRGGSLVLAVEQAPQVRRVEWRPGTLKDAAGAGPAGGALPPAGGAGGRRTVALATPYVLHLVRFFRESFEEMRVFYRAAPLQDEADALSLPNLWNVQAAESPLARCRACLRGRPALEGLALGAQATAAIEFFWAAGFNLDIEDNAFERGRGQDPRVASLEAWEAATVADPLFVLQVPWAPAGLTVRQAMEHLLHWGQDGSPVADAADLADLMYRLGEAP
jgi:hypothetical protein